MAFLVNQKIDDPEQTQNLFRIVALAPKFRWRIQPGAATALNFLGLSTQIPARAVYLSDGPDRVYQIGNTELAFEHKALKESGIDSRKAA